MAVACSIRPHRTRRRTTATVEQVPDGQDRVPPQHPRTGKPHHRPGSIALRRLVAMDRAAGAGGLLLAEGTAFEPLPSIVEQFGALGAEFASAAVMPTAIDADHCEDRPKFALQAFTEHRRILAHNAAKATRETAWAFLCVAARSIGGRVAQGRSLVCPALPAGQRRPINRGFSRSDSECDDRARQGRARMARGATLPRPATTTG